MIGSILPGRSLSDQAAAASGTTLLVPSYAPVLAVAGLLLYALYRWALLKPISGIPYNAGVTSNLLGDIPSLVAGINRTGEFNVWLLEQATRLRAPLFQVFIRPFSKPVLILCDFREAQDVLMRRKEFDRSAFTGDLLEGTGPDHHISMKTNGEWKRHRRLLQDLMSPTFLHEVAGPNVYDSVLGLIELWNDKVRIADGRPFSAETDIYHGALDAVLAFTFGGDFSSSAIRPTKEVVRGLGAEDVKKLQGSSTATAARDEVLDFPEGAIDDKIKATLDVPGAIEYLVGSPIPRYKWWFVKRYPTVRQAIEIKQKYVREEIVKGVQRLQQAGDEETKVLSAVELMLLREKKLAESEGRQPDFFSNVMVDEIFGVVVAGHDTTSTTMCWGVKFLADNPQTQTRLRDALRTAFVDAAAENRSPTIKEITSTKIPYLDATMEEILRCGGATLLVDREAQCDTQLLGHHIPKGTVVMCLSRGPSMLQPAFEVDEAKRSKSCLAAKARVWDDDDIGVFKPERWLVPSGEQFEFDQTAGPSLAFGLGTRGCFGRKLAYLELRLLVTLIAWNFELLPCPKGLSGYAAREGLTRKPRDCYVRLKALGKS